MCGLHVLFSLLIIVFGAITTSLPAPDGEPVCPTHAIQFTQDTGCLNDGSVEFCIPANNPAALATVQQIAPGTTCHPWGGRARCDTTRELLCMVPTRGMCRTDDPRAMTGAGWATVCELAALPFVDQIVPTWYE